MAARNPQKNYDFSLEVDGLTQAYLQGVSPPSVEYAEHKHGSPGNNPDRKTPGKKLVGDLTAETVVETTETDADLWAKFEAVRTQLRAAYIGQGFLVELGPGNTPVGRWFLKDIWVKKIESSGYDSRGDNSADLMRNVTFSVEDYTRV